MFYYLPHWIFFLSTGSIGFGYFCWSTTPGCYDLSWIIHTSFFPCFQWIGTALQRVLINIWIVSNTHNCEFWVNSRVHISWINIVDSPKIEEYILMDTWNMIEDFNEMNVELNNFAAKKSIWWMGKEIFIVLRWFSTTYLARILTSRAMFDF